MNEEISHEIVVQEIEVAAYFNWINEGCPEGSELSDWHRAEAQIAQSIELKRIQECERDRASHFLHRPAVSFTQQMLLHEEEAYGKTH